MLGVFWKSKTGKITLNDDFYYDWYGYIDAELSTNEMQLLINQVNATAKSTFDKWKMEELRNEHNKINDLLGIKYMRDDNLKLAYRYFSKVDKNHYTNAPLFNENPFYKIKGYMNFDRTKTEKNYTKATLVYKLMQLRNKVAQPNHKTKSQDYLLIANCYYNMSYYGNSWMMKRISRTANKDENYDDETEYYQCSKAKYYYEKAMEHSKSKDFKALCLYMKSKCEAREKEYLVYKQYEKDYYVKSEQLQKVREKAFDEFITKYPSHYNEMMSNCEIFAQYFKGA